MIEYGYINEEGYLRSKMLEVLTEKYKDESEEIKERVVTIEEQAALLIEQGWKPVDIIDESRMIAEEGYSIEISPYDNGDRISYRYEIVFDKKVLVEEIKRLKNMLSSTESDIGDYKITKCYEASLTGEALPYDIAILREKRQKVRDRINNLEKKLADNK